jgi:hypothetical protein
MSAGEARRNDGSGEYAYEFLMSDEERQRYDRQ